MDAALSEEMRYTANQNTTFTSLQLPHTHLMTMKKDSRDAASPDAPLGKMFSVLYFSHTVLTILSDKPPSIFL